MNKIRKYAVADTLLTIANSIMLSAIIFIGLEWIVSYMFNAFVNGDLTSTASDIASDVFYTQGNNNVLKTDYQMFMIIKYDRVAPMVDYLFYRNPGLIVNSTLRNEALKIVSKRFEEAHIDPKYVLQYPEVCVMDWGLIVGKLIGKKECENYPIGSPRIFSKVVNFAPTSYEPVYTKKDVDMLGDMPMSPHHLPPTRIHNQKNVSLTNKMRMGV